VLHELLYKDFSDIVGDSFPLVGSPSWPAGETAHEVPEGVSRAAAQGYSLKWSGVRSGVGARVLGGGGYPGGLWQEEELEEKEGIPGRGHLRPWCRRCPSGGRLERFPREAEIISVLDYSC